MDMGIVKKIQESICSTGQVHIIMGPTNQRQFLDACAYKHTSKGLVKYQAFSNDVFEFLYANGITNTAEQKEYLKRIKLNLCLGPEEINKDADHLIVTKEGQCLDMIELARIIKDGQDTDKESLRWLKPITEYEKNNLIQRMGANYTSNFNDGKIVLQNYLKLVLYDSSDGMVDWVIKFFARLVYDRNHRKEFVRLIGEKNSGKTAIGNFLYNLLGTYAGILTDKVFYGTDSDTSNKELFALQYHKVLMHTESNATKRAKNIDTTQIKRITGNSLIKYKDCVFSLQVKILDEGNGFPEYDADAAFNERAYFILFRKNTDVPSYVIDGVIEDLKTHKDSIFSYLLHLSAEDFDKEILRPESMKLVQQWVQYYKDPVKAFYENACIRNQAISTPAIVAYRLFQEWVRLYLRPHGADIPILKETTIPIPSEIIFNRKMTTLHGSFIPHRNRGAVFQLLEIKCEKNYWGDYLEAKRDGLDFIARQNVLETLADAKGKMETVDQAEKSDAKVTEKIAEVQKDIQELATEKPQNMVESLLQNNSIKDNSSIIIFNQYLEAMFYAQLCRQDSLTNCPQNSLLSSAASIPPHQKSLVAEVFEPLQSNPEPEYHVTKPGPYADFGPIEYGPDGLMFDNSTGIWTKIEE
ncbi:hypothetical protein TREPR_0911 [Treponema primitia ZAS-2]|uniref:Uncharacterized protein n=1 Tax=Treponema primitia (strain ATCC BAA-887 / DSM 12427 / ZAS-2) TaxID=545694 RepID=F5YI82_TREPZ|nr:hypothetical protein [Treponema primitia]AEF85637.1 hypothetical protein TREPR_0911 [Treponema primitia ZAS-2]